MISVTWRSLAWVAWALSRAVFDTASLDRPEAIASSPLLTRNTPLSRSGLDHAVSADDLIQKGPLWCSRHLASSFALLTGQYIRQAARAFELAAPVCEHETV